MFDLLKRSAARFLVATLALMSCGAQAGVIIDSFDSGPQHESHTGGGGSVVAASTVLGGMRLLHVVSTTATVSGSSPGSISVSGDSGQTTRIDLHYGAVASAHGATDSNLDLTGETEISFDFKYLTGEARIDSIQLYGDSGNDVWIQQNIVSLTADANPFTATVDFSLFAPTVGSETDLNTFLGDVDGMLIYVIGNNDITWEINQIAFGDASASSGQVPLPGSIALLGLGLASFMYWPSRLK